MSEMDLGTQAQPGDAIEDELRMDRAIELADYLVKHPGPIGSVRYRIENLSGAQSSERELELLADLVERLVDHEHWRNRK